MNPYLPILVILCLGIALGVILSSFSALLGPRHPSKTKKDPFECGMPTLPDQDRMSVKFYLTAILFILFDIETIFLYLWAKVFPDLGWFGFVEIVLFVLVLLVGYIYVLRSGALEWD